MRLQHGAVHLGQVGRARRHLERVRDHPGRRSQDGRRVPARRREAGALQRAVRRAALLVRRVAARGPAGRLHHNGGRLDVLGLGRRAQQPADDARDGGQLRGVCDEVVIGLGAEGVEQARRGAELGRGARPAKVDERVARVAADVLVGRVGAQQVQCESLGLAAVELGAVGRERLQVGLVHAKGALQHVARQHVHLQRVQHARQQRVVAERGGAGQRQRAAARGHVRTKGHHHLARAERGHAVDGRGRVHQDELGGAGQLLACRWGEEQAQLASRLRRAPEATARLQAA